MKNIGSRLGFNKHAEVVVDARELLIAKRKNNNIGDVRNILNKKSDTRFTIPVKTINNDIFKKSRPDNVNFSANKPNLRLITSTTQNMAGRKFADPKGSLGIFSRSVDDYKLNKRNEFYPREHSNDFFVSRENSRNNVEKKTDDGYRGPQSVHHFPNRSLNDSKVLFRSIIDSGAPVKSATNFRTSHRNSGELQQSIRTSVPKRSIDVRDSLETVKRQCPDNLEKVKFVVVNEDKPTRPSLTTPRLAYKSLISPIQGYRIEVKNLHPQVNVDDVFELFTSLGGDLRSCNLVRPGYGEVVFRTLSDAQKSIEEFHGRELDGRPMNLKLVTPAEEPSLQNVNTSVMTKINKIQSSRKPANNISINKDAVFRSMYLKSEDKLKTPFKFSVML